MSDKQEFDVDWAEATSFTWADYMKTIGGLLGLAALVWWMIP